MNNPHTSQVIRIRSQIVADLKNLQNVLKAKSIDETIAILIMMATKKHYKISAVDEIAVNLKELKKDIERSIKYLDQCHDRINKI